jgi:hypothetical protein
VTSGKNLDDVSDPTKFLWEFSDAELGQTWADPSISRTAVKDSSDIAWGTFFGSGYLPDPAQQANKEAYLYGILAQDATDYWKDAGAILSIALKSVAPERLPLILEIMTTMMIRSTSVKPLPVMILERWPKLFPLLRPAKMKRLWN